MERGRERRRRGLAPPGARAAAVAAVLLLAAPHAAAQCSRTFVANVVAIEQFVWYNRLGAHQPGQLMYVLEQDLVSGSGGAPSWSDHGLRPDRRPRPLVLRATAGSCLKVNFRNWLSDTGGSPGTRAASVHVTGMQLVQGIQDDGSHVGLNPTSLVEPGASATYLLYAEREGTYLMYSTAQTTGGDGNGGQIGQGLFGAVNVEPAGSEWYRSQLTRADMDLAADSITAAGYPAIDYDAVYPSSHPQDGRPIVRITSLTGDTIVHGDMNAVITGPGRGNFADSSHANPDVAVYNELDGRMRPFREFTVIFHDEVGLVQAFDSIYTSRQFEYTLHGGRDAFAINYGTGGIGSEILANRFGLGPMGECNECKFEEFFLSSWAVGDPAMVVDSPAAAVFSPGAPPPPGPRATLVRYPSDPSNVFHSYLNDHVRIRNLHAGPKEHHVFHLHAHQWLHTPNSDGANYLDSQTIGPGGGFTYEITYGGSGNRNETPGDAILHCHFYPHFAQGMWGLWRVHDVFERGTELDGDGRPTGSARALPDGEIQDGTPIPALVPLPTYALAPLPDTLFPGYPFYIPGRAGHRPPKPPLDTRFDGGLRRHVVTGGVAVFDSLNTRSFAKRDSLLQVEWLPEAGTPREQRAMAFHADSVHTTPVAGAWSTTGPFRTNGLPPRPGAPYADPCGVGGTAMGVPDSVKAAAVQLDTVYYNKAGWFNTQHRMFSLWGDVPALFSGQRAPEPLFFRVHDNTCLTYHLVNLIPAEYHMDDFQVETPTDVIGQHIHLVKFDVTSSDGAANGFNYEDGSLAPADVRHRIEAIRRFHGCDTAVDAENCPGPALPHPVLGAGPGDTAWVGAQETLQRWWVDPVLRGGGRTSPLGAVFTHDHFGPSTHQQLGLYAALIPEDTGTVWRDPETGGALGTRYDGGPTSWRADILYDDSTRSFREFNLQVADFTLAFGEDGFAGSLGRVPPINPPGKDEVGLPDLLRPPFVRANGPPGQCPNGIDQPPCPEIISADDPGTMVVNYRNEPLALRIRNPHGNHQAAADSGDLSYAFASTVPRADARLEGFGPYPQRPGVLSRDPYTPLMRVYEDDPVRVNLLVGAHEEGHNVNIRGTRWLFAPRDTRSGWRNSQVATISEYHQFFLTPLIGNDEEYLTDFVYESAATDGRWNGTWGLLRMYRTGQKTLCLLHDRSCGDHDAVTWLQRRVAVGGTLTSADSARVLADETGTAVSRSLQAARQDTTPARVDGFTQLRTYAPLPDPAEPATWRGSTSAVDGAKAADATYPGHSLPASALTAQDSVDMGYGNLAVGGMDYDQFEYDPSDSTEVVTADSTPPASLGLTYTGTLAYVQEPAGTPGTYEEPGPKYEARGDSVGFRGVCPRVAPVRFFDVTAIDARSTLPGGRIVYNTRTDNGGPLVDPTGILYVFTGDLEQGLVDDTPDPLVLRANAGECILLRVHNKMQTPLFDTVGWNTLPPIVDLFNSNDVYPSGRVGLHPQLVAYDAQRSDGSRAGINRNTTAAPGEYHWFLWYAGDLRVTPRGRFRATPIEFGAANLMSSDPIEHASKGAIGALVVEPRRARHDVDPDSRLRATIRAPGRTLRELVLPWQDDVNLRFGSHTSLPGYDCDAHGLSEYQVAVCEETGGVGLVEFAAGDPVPNLAGAEDPEDTGQKALGYRTEPLWFRMGYAPDAPLEFTRTLDFRLSLTDAQVGGERPQTPLLTVAPGDDVRFRILQPGGHARNKVFNLHGHVWEELPYDRHSRRLGSYPFSEWKGTRDGHGASNHHDVLPKHGAGGLFGVEGDFLYRDQASFLFDGGIWGLMTVDSDYATGPTNEEPDAGPTPGTGATVDGSCTVDASTGETVCSP